MPTFHSIADMERFLRSSQWQKLLGVHAEAILVPEAKRLQALLQKHIDAYYNSRQPNVYDRTDDLKTSLRLQDKYDVSAHGSEISNTS